ncbi:uncharacterized protein [Dysidea avara]|uniref:uncharacterized protein n=1 Tax=Dysidea avara TaxID=196820 RepID=UPI00331852C7
MQRIVRLVRDGFARGKAALGLMVKYPVISGPIVITMGYCVHQYTVQKNTNDAIYSKLKLGSKPTQTHFNFTADRSDVVSEIQKLLMESDAENGKFGVILGPKGTGKTHATIAACNIKSNGIVYKKINQPLNTPAGLASAAGIPVVPSIFDRIERLFGLQSSFYFPHDPVKATSYVLRHVAMKADQLQKEDNMKMLPCFVIDGAELVAKYQPEVFDTILRYAEYYATTKRLRIVLVFSDGDVLSSIEQVLGHRLVEVVEVLDLDDKDAEEYLTKRTNMSTGLAKRVVNLIGVKI